MTRITRRRLSHRFTATLYFAFAVAAFALLPAMARAESNITDPYKVGPGDKLRITVYKDPQDSLESVQVRPDGKITLTLIGDGPQATELKAHARTLGIAKLVQWTGWLDKEGMRDAYRNADVFLNPSLFEGMPNTVLEAMACGLPVIATRVMGNDEVVQHDKTGLLVTLTEPEALARAMTDLAQAPARRAAMATRARLVACKCYSWDATAAQYADIFSRGKNDARSRI